MPKATNLEIAFVKCDSTKREDCKSDEEIAEWFNFKYILVLENQK